MGRVGEVGLDGGFTFLPAFPTSHLSLSATPLAATLALVPPEVSAFGGSAHGKAAAVR